MRLCCNKTLGELKVVYLIPFALLMPPVAIRL